MSRFTLCTGKKQIDLISVSDSLCECVYFLGLHLDIQPMVSGDQQAGAETTAAIGMAVRVTTSQNAGGDNGQAHLDT